MRSSRKLKFERRKHFHSIEQPLINLNLEYSMIQIKLGYLKSIPQSRSSLLPSYCSFYRKPFLRVSTIKQILCTWSVPTRVLVDNCNSVITALISKQLRKQQMVRSSSSTLVGDLFLSIIVFIISNVLKRAVFILTVPSSF